MSAPEERAALVAPPSLYAYALRLHRAEPDGRLPKGGYPVPVAPRRRDAPEWRKARAAVTDVLTPLLTAPDTALAADEVHRRLRELAVRERHIGAAVAALPLTDETTARALGRRLAREGTSAPAVGVGVALLSRLGEPEDVPYLKILGLLRGFTRPAVDALSALDRPAAALLWLSGRVEDGELRHLVDALASLDDEAVRACLLTIPLGPDVVDPSTARRIAEAVRLADALAADPVDPGLLARAARLLARMTSLRDYRAEILGYAEAVTAYDALVARATQLPPTLDHYATLLSLALDLHSGSSFLLDWRPGQRESLLNTLGSVLRTPAWDAVLSDHPDEPDDPDVRRRAEWIRRAARQPFTVPATAPARFRIDVVVRDPADRETVETRLLVDGRPLVPEAFGLGPANPPEYLLDSGRLRAGPEPRTVQLAEAYCTEGCCGALHVTICREGDHVVWRDWSRPHTPPSLRSELPEYRFDAADYDAEIARAENDHSWSWPAQSTARLIAAGLRDRPDLLTRWGARLDWVGTHFDEPDLTVLCFTCAAEPATGDRDSGGSPVQHLWRIPDDGTPPADRAAAALERLATAHPRTYDEARR